jgi:hypothetical protein
MAENIQTHPTAHLTGIDPFLDPDYITPGAPRTYKEVFYSNLKASLIESKVDIIEGYSQLELRKLPLESYDVIYIDGSHDMTDVLEDAVLSSRLLKDGGLLIFDDYRLDVGMKRAIDTFFTFFRDDFEPVHVGWQVILRKKAVDRSSEKCGVGKRRSSTCWETQTPGSPGGQHQTCDGKRSMDGKRSVRIPCRMGKAKAHISGRSTPCALSIAG